VRIGSCCKTGLPHIISNLIGLLLSLSLSLSLSLFLCVFQLLEAAVVLEQQQLSFKSEIHSFSTSL
jgi:hypothetical protein